MYKLKKKKKDLPRIPMSHLPLLFASNIMAVKVSEKYLNIAFWRATSIPRILFRNLLMLL